MNYFSENLLQAQTQDLPKKSIKALEKTAQKIAESLTQTIFNFNQRLNQLFFNHIEEENKLSPEKLADDLFNDNLTARLSFIDQEELCLSLSLLKRLMPVAS